MNTSVAAFAPKGKTYTMTNSHLNRVSIAAGISIAGHKQLWINDATKLEFTCAANFLSYLKLRDRNKKKNESISAEQRR